MFLSKPTDLERMQIITRHLRTTPFETGYEWASNGAVYIVLDHFRGEGMLSACKARASICTDYRSRALLSTATHSHCRMSRNHPRKKEDSVRRIEKFPCDSPLSDNRSQAARVTSMLLGPHFFRKQVPLILEYFSLLFSEKLNICQPRHSSSSSKWSFGVIYN